MHAARRLLKETVHAARRLFTETVHAARRLLSKLYIRLDGCLQKGRARGQYELVFLGTEAVGMHFVFFHKIIDIFTEGLGCF